MAEPWEVRVDGLRLYVKLTPKATRDAITGIETDAEGRARLEARVTAAPEKGKANKALIKLLAKRLGIAPSHLELISGATSRHKTVRVEGLSGDEISAALPTDAGAAHST